MKRAEYIKIVKAELDNIKTRATAEEISRLNFKDFRHTQSDNCIYGQMTGDCFSDRAKAIQGKVLEYAVPINSFYNRIKYSDIEFGEYFGGKNFTYLEQYLYLTATLKGNKSKAHETILKYLKGEIDSITLK